MNLTGKGTFERRSKFNLRTLTGFLLHRRQVSSPLQRHTSYCGLAKKKKSWTVRTVCYTLLHSVGRCNIFLCYDTLLRFKRLILRNFRISKFAIIGADTNKKCLMKLVYIYIYIYIYIDWLIDWKTLRIYERHNKIKEHNINDSGDNTVSKRHNSKRRGTEIAQSV